MFLSINSNNYIKELPVVNNELNTVQQNTISNNQTSLAVNLEPKQTLLNKETIVQLQEVQDYSILQITSKKEEVDFNGTPSLEWLKGYCGDNRLYNQTVNALSNGFSTIEKFTEIVERNKNSESISHKDWYFITCHIEGFKNGFEFFKENSANSLDPKVSKVLDYISPKTLQRLNVLKQYLSTKTIEPEIEFELKDVDIKEIVDIATINDNSCKKADDLLNFLVKDLEWYKCFLEDKKQPFISYSLQYLHLTRSITYSLTINETMQVV
jgi:hypothetical protein